MFYRFLPTCMMAAQIKDQLSPDTKARLKSILHLVFDDTLYHAIFLIILAFCLVKLVDLSFKPLQKNDTIQRNFLRGVIKAFIIITFALRIGALSDTFTKFYQSILMSSSLLIVVLGFVFQEGLSNIVHGFLLIISKPFNIGDRVRVNIDGESISGYIRSITLRNTVIQTIATNSMVIIPNAKMDTSLIDNSYIHEKTSSNFLDLTITYDSDFEKAIQIIGKTVAAHPLVRAARPIEERDKPVNVLVSNLLDSSVNLRVCVLTNTIEENFQACSDIRLQLLLTFKKDPDIDFAYPHMDVTLKK